MKWSRKIVVIRFALVLHDLYFKQLFAHLCLVGKAFDFKARLVPWTTAV